MHLHRKSNRNRDTNRFIDYLCRMTTNKITPEELWARQQISPLDVDYNLWNERRASIQTFSQMSQSCIFTVDVFKERYDFASDNFATIFGYNPTWIKTIRKQGDLLRNEFTRTTGRNSSNTRLNTGSSSIHFRKKKEMIISRYSKFVC